MVKACKQQSLLQNYLKIGKESISLVILKIQKGVSDKVVLVEITHINKTMTNLKLPVELFFSTKK